MRKKLSEKERKILMEGYHEKAEEDLEILEDFKFVDVSANKYLEEETPGKPPMPDAGLSGGFTQAGDRVIRTRVPQTNEEVK